MDLFNVIITDRARFQLESYADYIYYTLLNETAAKSLLQDVRETQKPLESVAVSLQYCKHPELKRLGYRSICFLRYRYIMVYRVIGKNAFVEAICHQLQDYENIFAEEVGRTMEKP